MFSIRGLFIKKNVKDSKVDKKQAWQIYVPTRNP